MMAQASVICKRGTVLGVFTLILFAAMLLRTAEYICTIPQLRIFINLVMEGRVSLGQAVTVSQDWQKRRQIRLPLVPTARLHGPATLRRAIILSSHTRHGRVNLTWLERYSGLEMNFYRVSNGTAASAVASAAASVSSPVASAIADTVIANMTTKQVNANVSSLPDPRRGGGREATVYLTHIIAHYDNLADANVFLHGHITSWHQRQSLPEIFDWLNWDHKGFFNLRCPSKGAFPHGCSVQTPVLFSPGGGDAYQQFFTLVWRRVLQPHGFGELPALLEAACCAQFFVSKAAILQHSRAFYQALLGEISRREGSGEEVGMVFEYLWHIIFSRQAVLCPDYNECQCEVYNICLTPE